MYIFFNGIHSQTVHFKPSIQSIKYSSIQCKHENCSFLVDDLSVSESDETHLQGMRSLSERERRERERERVRKRERERGESVVSSKQNEAKSAEKNRNLLTH